MSSAAPPVLPISSNQGMPSTNSSASAQGQPPIAAPAFRSFIYNLSDSLRSGIAHRRPWTELADRSAFSKPESLSEAAQRIRKNYSYFRVNYVAITALIVVFSLVTHPFSLFLLTGLLASWLFLYLIRPSDQPVILFGRSYNDRETLGILIVVSIVVVFLTSVGSLLISAGLIGMFVVCIHGSFRSPEDLFVEEPEAATTGFLTFIGNAASSAAAVASPAISSARV